VAVVSVNQFTTALLGAKPNGRLLHQYATDGAKLLRRQQENEIDPMM
jgi:hypothetical protein